MDSEIKPVNNIPNVKPLIRGIISPKKDNPRKKDRQASNLRDKDQLDKGDNAEKEKADNEPGGMVDIEI